MRSIALLLAAGTLTLTACITPVDPKVRAELSQIPYPKDAALGDDLDIVVTRSGGHITLNNRTPRTYENMELWLNQQYVGILKRIEIGKPDTNLVSLGRIINEFGEPFPRARLLAPEKAFPVVLAELFDPTTGQRHRLLVRRK